MKRLIYIVLLIVLVLANIATLTDARVYNGANKGIVWDAGGVEVIGEPGVFLCSDDYSLASNTHWHNPLADIWPSLVVDC